MSDGCTFYFKEPDFTYTPSDHNKEYKKGWNDCKREVLKILKRDWTGLDMSINSCDRYYIDKIKEL